MNVILGSYLLIEAPRRNLHFPVQCFPSFDQRCRTPGALDFPSNTIGQFQSPEFLVSIKEKIKSPGETSLIDL